MNCGRLQSRCNGLDIGVNEVSRETGIWTMHRVCRSVVPEDHTGDGLAGIVMVVVVAAAALVRNCEEKFRARVVLVLLRAARHTESKCLGSSDTSATRAGRCSSTNHKIRGRLGTELSASCGR